MQKNQIFQLIVLMIMFLTSCSEKPNSIKEQDQIKNEYLREYSDKLTGINLDSLFYNSDTLFAYITDNYHTYYSQVIAEQTFWIFFQNLIDFKSDSLKHMKVYCQIPKRDSSGYFITYDHSLDKIKNSLRDFSNEYFKQLVNEITRLHSNYPEEDLFDKLNTASGMILEHDKKIEDSFFGFNFMKTLLPFLIECKDRKNDYFTNLLNRTFNLIDKEKTLSTELSKKVKIVIQKNCEEIITNK